ncbi:ABC transporter permease [Reyranella sp.]|uniref:ABC transporter permease n=1 Tax=Reyranella sp. TaxID=1929291 RepID=UPI003BAD9760
MTSTGASREGRRPWVLRGLGRIGAATSENVRSLLLFMAFAATVVAAAFRRGSWSAPVWNEFQRVLRHVALGSLPTTIATGLLVGFTLVSQAVYWLAQTGTTSAVGPVIAAVLVRELVPILVGLIVFGRNGTATLIELGEARINGWLRLYEVQGLDAMELLIMPRALAFAVGAFCLATVLVVTTLLTGYLVAHTLGLVAYSIFDFVDLVSRSLAGRDFILPPLKCLAIGFFVGVTCCATGLTRYGESDELQRLVPRGFVRSALAILAVNSLLDLA